MANRHEKEWPVLLQVAKQYNLSTSDLALLLAIRDAENGPEKNEFGVKAARNTDLKTQAKWAAGSIVANRKRYQDLLVSGKYEGSRRTIELKDGKAPSFVDFMAYMGSPTGYGWAPIHAPDMPVSEIKLNKAWSKNVSALMDKYKEEVKQYE